MIKETDESKITHRFLRLGAGGDGSVQAGTAWMRGLCSGDEIGTMSKCDFFPQLLARPQRVPTQPIEEDLGKEVPGTLWRFLLSSHQVEEQP